MDDKRQKDLIEFIKSIALSNHDVPDDIREDALTFYSELAGAAPTKEEPPVKSKPVSKPLDFDADEKPTYKKAELLPEVKPEVKKRPNPNHPRGFTTIDDTTRWITVPVPDYPLDSFTLTLHQYNNISILVLGDTQQAIDLLAMYTGIFIADAEYIVKNWYVLANGA